MKDSPFRVRVGGREESDPMAVTAEGAGLKGGETGNFLHFVCLLFFFGFLFDLNP